MILSDVQINRFCRVVRKSKDREFFLKIIRKYLEEVGSFSVSQIQWRGRTDHKKARKIWEAIYKDEYDTRDR